MTTIGWAAIAQRPAELVLVAGPNGSGKTTLAESYIARRFPIWPKLNADRLLLGLERLGQVERPSPPLQAAQIIDTTARGLALLREPFVLETVLSSPKYQSLVSTAREAGLIFRLVYITTRAPQINVERVHQRVLDGGHDVPENKIRERWVRSMQNLSWFAARADRMLVVDNSGFTLEPLALRHLGGPVEMLEADHPASRGLAPLVGTAALHVASP